MKKARDRSQTPYNPPSRPLLIVLSGPSGVGKDAVLTRMRALGYPLEIPVVEELTDSIKYWKDKDGTLHVPKRKLEDILYWQKYENKK